MRNKRNNNIKILQRKIKGLAVNDDKTPKDEEPLSGYGSKNDVMKEVLLVVKPVKKKGIKKDELISTRRLLTM